MEPYVLNNPNETGPERLKRKAKDACVNALDWAARNREWLAIVTPMVVGGVTTLVKVASRSNAMRKQTQLKNLYCYDASLGHYWRLKRKLSNKEWLEISRRKNCGEALGDILEELKVLK